MASVMLGRSKCPECGFESAHVKQSEKCIYRYCPECGAQHHAKTPTQQQHLMAKTRLIEPPTGTQPSATPTPTPTPTAEQPTATPTPTATPAPAKRRGLFA